MISLLISQFCAYLTKLLFISVLRRSIQFFHTYFLFFYINDWMNILMKNGKFILLFLSSTLIIRLTQLNYIFCSFASGYVYETSIPDFFISNKIYILNFMSYSIFFLILKHLNSIIRNEIGVKKNSSKQFSVELIRSSGRKRMQRMLTFEIFANFKYSSREMNGMKYLTREIWYFENASVNFQYFEFR